MVQQADVQQGQRLFQSPRDGLIGQAGFADTGRVIVCCDQRCRTVTQRPLGDHARVDRRAVDGAVEQFLEGDHAMARVEKEAGENHINQNARQFTPACSPFAGQRKPRGLKALQENQPEQPRRRQQP